MFACLQTIIDEQQFDAIIPCASFLLSFDDSSPTLNELSLQG